MTLLQWIRILRERKYLIIKKLFNLARKSITKTSGWKFCYAFSCWIKKLAKKGQLKNQAQTFNSKEQIMKGSASDSPSLCLEIKTPAFLDECNLIRHSCWAQYFGNLIKLHGLCIQEVRTGVQMVPFSFKSIIANRTWDWKGPLGSLSPVPYYCQVILLVSFSNCILKLIRFLPLTASIRRLF